MQVMITRLVIVFFLLGDSPASEFYMPKSRNIMFHLHRRSKCYTAYEDGRDRVYRNVVIQNSDAGESPKRKHATFSTRRKFEIKKGKM